MSENLTKPVVDQQKDWAQINILLPAILRGKYQLGGVPLAIFLYVLLHHNKSSHYYGKYNPACEISPTRFAKMCGCSRDGIYKAIETLLQERLIKRVVNGAKKKQYIINENAMKELLKCVPYPNKLD